MNNVLQKAIDCYGDLAQIDKAIEEMSELIKALLKQRYCDKDHLQGIVQDAVDEEMADVEIMLEQLTMIFNNRERVDYQKEKKIERLAHRLNMRGQ